MSARIPRSRAEPAAARTPPSAAQAAANQNTAG